MTGGGRSFSGGVKEGGVCAARVSFGVLAAHLSAENREPSFPLNLFPRRQADSLCELGAPTLFCSVLHLPQPGAPSYISSVVY